jgi:hypothetical protein
MGMHLSVVNGLGRPLVMHLSGWGPSTGGSDPLPLGTGLGRPTGTTQWDREVSRPY